MVTELYDALRKAGVDEQIAMNAARAVLPADSRTDLATKADLTDLTTKAELTVLKTDIAEFRAETKADIAELRTAMAEMKVELIKWNVGAMAVLTAIFAAIVRLG